MAMRASGASSGATVGVAAGVGVGSPKTSGVGVLKIDELMGKGCEDMLLQNIRGEHPDQRDFLPFAQQTGDARLARSTLTATAR